DFSSRGRYFLLAIKQTWSRLPASTRPTSAISISPSPSSLASHTCARSFSFMAPPSRVRFPLPTLFFFRCILQFFLGGFSFAFLVDEANADALLLGRVNGTAHGDDEQVIERELRRRGVGAGIFVDFAVV